MERGRPIAVFIAVLVAACIVAPVPAFAARPAPAKRVFLVLAPYVTWEDVTPTSTPTLWRLAGTGAVGDLNARSRTRQIGEPPSPLEGALTISAGDWAIPDFSAPAAFDATETYETDTAGVGYLRVFGSPATGAGIVYLGLPGAAKAALAKSSEAVYGTLGQGVRDAGGFTAAIGNSDAGYATGDLQYERPAAVAAMDALGKVDAGDVSRELLRESPDAPYGLATDLSAFEAALEHLAGNGRGRSPELIVLDPGDLYRARRFAPEVADAAAARQKAAALASLDAVVAMAEKRRGPDGVVIVASQALYSDTSGGLQGFGPVIVSGSGWEGYLTSASTHRVGVVTNPDVTASILAALGLPSPVQVVGDPFEVTVAPASARERVARLERMDATAIAIDSAKAGVLNTYIGFVAALLGLSAFVIARGWRWRVVALSRCVTTLKGGIIFALALPAASWLALAAPSVLTSPGVATTVLLGIALVAWVLATAASRFGERVPIGGLALFTVALLLVDQWMGAPLSFAGFFGYSPLLAARFYGMGNESSALIVGASLVGVTLLLDQYADARWALAARRYGVVALGAVVVLTAAAPFLGANVGVVIWGSVGFVLAWVLMNGHRFGWKAAVATALIIIVLIVAFSAIDLLGHGQQTHLGRSLVSAEEGGAGQLWAIVTRKARTNMRVLTRTNWSFILLSVLAFLGFERFRSRDDYARTLAENRHFGSAIVATIVTGMVAFFTEDSGIVIPALILLYTGLGLAWLMLSRTIAEEARG